MIELIFVIVILGILAAVAVPKLAATRDDAKVAALQTDINTYVNAIPAWFAGQKDARIAQAVSLDTAQWKKSTTAGEEAYTLSLDGGNGCVTIQVVDSNGTNEDTTPTINAVTGAFTATTTNGVPVLKIIKHANAANAGTVCTDLWTRVTEQNITMGGKRVAW